MALPNYTSKHQIRQQHNNWNDQRVNRVWNRQSQMSTTPGAAAPAAPSTPAPSQPAQGYATEASGPAANFTLTQDPGYQGAVYSPQASSAHPFFDPNSNYAQPGRQYEVLPGMGQPGNNAFNQYGTDNPEGYYYAVLNQRGLGGLDARSQVAQGMFRDVARGYEAAKMKNMALWFPEYLEQWDPNDVLDMLSEEQLGIDRSRFAGRDRWGMRGGQ